MRRRSRMKTLKILRLFAQGRIVVFIMLLCCSYILCEPGYLDFDNLPETNFTCAGKVIGGYYADLETSCQMFHVCTIGQLDEPMDIKFLCLNGTVFDQETRVCERVDEVDCTKSERFYYLNLELYGNTMVPSPEESTSISSPTVVSTTPTTTTSTTRKTAKVSSTTTAANKRKHESTTSNPNYYTTTTIRTIGSDHEEDEEYEYDDDYLTTDGKDLHTYDDSNSNSDFTNPASPNEQAVFSPEQFIFRQSTGKEPSKTDKPAISFQQQHFQNGDSLTVTNSHVTSNNSAKNNKMFSSKPNIIHSDHQEHCTDHCSTTRKPQYSFNIFPAPSPTTPKRLPLLPLSAEQQSPPSGHPGLPQIPTFRLPAQGFRLSVQPDDSDSHKKQQTQHVESAQEKHQRQLEQHQEQLEKLQQQEHDKQQKQQEQLRQHHEQQRKEQERKQQQEQHQQEQQQQQQQRHIFNIQTSTSTFEGYRRHMPQQTPLRLPIENGPTAHEFINFDKADIDFPQQEHKDQKRSDPAASAPRNSNSTQQTRSAVFHPKEYRETSSSSSSRKNNQQLVNNNSAAKEKSLDVAASNHAIDTPTAYSLNQHIHQQIQNSNHNYHNNNYDKVLLTPQDQYISALPKVIITASASVSDGSGKKLNYSVGHVIGPNIKIPPPTYDEYKEDDVVLDPFFLDVLKINPRRNSKRDANQSSHYSKVVKKKRRRR